MRRQEVPEEEGYVQVTIGQTILHGNLLIPAKAIGLVAFAHGSGSGRHSPRNQYVAKLLRDSGLATLLFDLLTLEEEAEDLIKDLLGRLHYTGKDKRLIRPDPQIVFAYDASNLENSQLAK